MKKLLATVATALALMLTAATTAHALKCFPTFSVATAADGDAAKAPHGSLTPDGWLVMSSSVERFLKELKTPPALVDSVDAKKRYALKLVQKVAAGRLRQFVFAPVKPLPLGATLMLDPGLAEIAKRIENRTWQVIAAPAAVESAALKMRRVKVASAKPMTATRFGRRWSVDYQLDAGKAPDVRFVKLSSKKLGSRWLVARASGFSLWEHPCEAVFPGLAAGRPAAVKASFDGTAASASGTPRGMFKLQLKVASQ